VPAIVTADSVTELDAGHRGAVLVAGSHGGRIAAYYAPFRGRRDELDATDTAEEVLEAGAAKVRPVVDDTMKAVRAAMSLG